MSIVKVGVCAGDNCKLLEIDKAKTLDENIKYFCQNFNICPTNYSLKWKTSTTKSTQYITSDNYHNINDADIIEIVPSLDTLIEEIFDSNFTDNSRRSLLLFDLSIDQGFIERLYILEKCNRLMEFILDNTLNSQGRRGCLHALHTLLQLGYVTGFSEDVLLSIIEDVKLKMEPGSYALALLAQILVQRKDSFKQIKLIIINNICMDTILLYITCPTTIEIAVNALMLINAIIKAVKGEKRYSIIKELNTLRNLHVIFDLACRDDITDRMSAQLFYLQSFLLIKYRIDFVKDVSRFSIDFDIPQCSRLSTGQNDDEIYLNDMDTLNSGTINKVENDTVYKDNVSRYSLTSINSLTTTSNSNHNSLINEHCISLVTYNCIVYYKTNYFTWFCKSLSEENHYDPGFCRASDRVIRLLGDVFKFNGTSYKNCKHFTRIFFNPKVGNFVEEFYVRMMFLLSKTRREMNVKTRKDFDKLIIVLSKQLYLILRKKDKSFKEFHQSLREINFQVIKKQLMDEHKLVWLKTLQNPCVMNLMTEFQEQNACVLYEQRMLVLQEGKAFNKLREKKYKEYFYLKLSSNRKVLLYGDWDFLKKEWKQSKPKMVNIKEIRHLVVGQACNHVKDGNVPETKVNFAFSLILNGEVYLNCLCEDEMEANYWIDGLRILLGYKQRSKDYETELRNLCEVDCALHLIELQDVEIPFEAPPIPSYVPIVDF